jgi:hypothetical protein
VPFAAGPEDVGDDPGDGRPRLVLIGYDADAVRGDRLQIPPIVERIFRTKGTQGDFRQLQNHLVFLIADEQLRDEMKHAMVRRLALQAMRAPDRLAELAPHQQDKVREHKTLSSTGPTPAIGEWRFSDPSRHSDLEPCQPVADALCPHYARSCSGSPCIMRRLAHEYGRCPPFVGGIVGRALIVARTA